MRVLFIATILLSSPVWADQLVGQLNYGLSTDLGEDVSCYQDSLNGTEWKYCITTTKNSTNPDVLFEFHGISESENSWITKERDLSIRQAWHDLKLQPPTVVSLSFGQVWLLAEKNAAERSGLFELYRDTIYPRLLAKLGEIKGRKIALGASMGGFNVSQIYMKTPGFFDRYAMICPIVAELSPFADNYEIDRYVYLNHANPLRVHAMIKIAKDYFADPASFAKADVLGLVDEVKESRPPLYLSCSHEDPYGIYHGVETFKDKAIKRGLKVKFVDTHGGHCTIDPADLARYLVGE
jgi:hypothetical protein